MTTTQTHKLTRVCSKFLKSVVKNADQRKALAYMLDVTPRAVSLWMDGANNTSYANIVQLSLLYGVPTTRIVDDPYIFDKDHASLRSLDRELIRDRLYKRAKGAAGVYNRVHYKDFVKRLSPEPFNPAIRPGQGEEIKSKLSQNDVLSVATTDADMIKRVLADAEAIRNNLDLEWVVREDGKLGARRVITEEF
jgi:hypothetical protein